MEQEELDWNKRIYESEHSLNSGNYIPIPKSELVVGKTYRGVCRNADTAVWDGEKFWYDRYKLGDVYREGINHYEDDDGCDVFVPFEPDNGTMVLTLDAVKKLSDMEYFGTVKELAGNPRNTWDETSARVKTVKSDDNASQYYYARILDGRIIEIGREDGYCGGPLIDDSHIMQLYLYVVGMGYHEEGSPLRLLYDKIRPYLGNTFGKYIGVESMTEEEFLDMMKKIGYTEIHPTCEIEKI